MEELEWDGLMFSEWKTLENIHKFLKPFAQYMALAGGEDYTTISCVILIYLKLELRNEKNVRFKKGSNMLLTELQRRFAKYIVVECPGYDPTFGAAILVDPRYRLLLIPNR